MYSRSSILPGLGFMTAGLIDVLHSLNDPTPFLRGIVAEYAPDHLEIPYEQQKCKAGKSKNRFFTLFDAAMLSFTSYTKGGLRFATLWRVRHFCGQLCYCCFLSGL